MPGSPEARCVIDGQPCADHLAFRYFWAAYWRHHLFQGVAIVRGCLPFGRPNVS